MIVHLNPPPLESAFLCSGSSSDPGSPLLSSRSTCLGFPYDWGLGWESHFTNPAGSHGISKVIVRDRRSPSVLLMLGIGDIVYRQGEHSHVTAVVAPRLLHVAITRDPWAQQLRRASNFCFSSSVRKKNVAIAVSHIKFLSRLQHLEYFLPHTLNCNDNDTGTQNMWDEFIFLT